MSFASAARRFAAQAAREMTHLSPATIQPYATDGTTVDGDPICVFLSPVRAEREIAENGFVIIHRAQLRVPKTPGWAPVEGLEFTRPSTSERFRCNTAIGADSAFAAEIVCDVIRISP